MLTVLLAYGYSAIMKTRRQLKERNVVFRLTNEDVQRLDRMAEHESRSRSQVLRRMVRDALQKIEQSQLVENGV